MGPFQIFVKIRGDIANFAFFAAVNDTSDLALFRIINNSMTPAIYLSSVTTTSAINNHR
jgi:hypothetical protein